MNPVTMRLEFDVPTALSPEEVRDFFKTPSDWPRLFTAFRPATLRKDGWTTVPIRRSPIPLVAKITVDEPGRVAWKLRGFWKGDGEVRFEAVADGTRVTGYEQIDLPRLLGLGRLIARWAEPRFALVWESGWRRLRKMKPEASAT
ncbi:MAG: hypothetical protein QNJ89_02700 [Acidimicrobiia bacterium]|nr:hypothetical protein [Acidimicrobiia bacterium]